jgi:hypothetical protein
MIVNYAPKGRAEKGIRRTQLGPNKNGRKW